MTDQNLNPEQPQDTATPETASQRLPSLLSALLAIAAWAVLLFSSGYKAIAVAAVAAIVGFVALGKGWRTMATAAIIASLVLIVVTVAFLIVIKYIL